MSDIEIKLEPQDEYNHAPDEASNYNESMYFNVFDHQKKMGGWFRLGTVSYTHLTLPTKA